MKNLCMTLAAVFSLSFLGCEGRASALPSEVTEEQDRLDQAHALELLAAGATQEAAEVYGRLSQRHPDNAEYAQMASVLTSAPDL